MLDLGKINICVYEKEEQKINSKFGYFQSVNLVVPRCHRYTLS